MDEVLQRILSCIGPKHGAQKDLADYLGIHPNVITNWKNGRNKSYRGYLKEIASYFGVSVGYLLGTEPEPLLTQDLGSAETSVGLGEKKAPPLSDEAMRLAEDYDSLDEYGKRMVRTVTDNELFRVFGTEEKSTRVQNA